MVPSDVSGLSGAVTSLKCQAKKAELSNEHSQRISTNYMNVPAE